MDIFCKLCLSREEVIIYLDQCGDYLISPLQIIQECTKIQLVGNNFSNCKICCKCTEQLKNIHMFYMKATDTQEVLKNKYSANTKTRKSDALPQTKKIFKESKILPKPVTNNGLLNQLVILNNVGAGNNLFLVPNHQCSKCNLQFMSPELLKCHYKNAHADLLFAATCSTCKIEFKTRDELREHNLTIHFQSQSGTVSCEKCNKKFKIIKNLEHHSKIAHGQLKNTEIVKSNLDSEANENNCNICELCNRSFNTAKNLKLHKMYHVGFVCSFCEKAFCSQDYLQKHITEHHQEKRYLCVFCKKTQNEKKALFRHYKQCHKVDKNVIICGHCDNLSIGFSKLKDAENHMMNIHKNILPNDDSPTTTAETEMKFVNIHFNKSTGKIVYTNSEDFVINSKGEVISTEKLLPKKDAIVEFNKSISDLVCQICEDVFPTKHLLIEHLSSSHFIDYDGELEESEPKHSCLYCKKSFVHIHNLESHLLKYHCNDSCRYCGADIPDKFEMEDHMKLCKIDKLADKYTCKICGKCLTTTTGLKYHIESHNGDLRFACTNCNKRFLTQGNLKNHFRTVHSNIKPHICSKCKQGFASANHLRKHMAAHLGQRDFLCTVCGKTFYQSSHVRHHMWTHTRIKPYVCPYCQNVYTSKSSLTMHVKKNHPDKQEDVNKFKFKLNPIEMSIGGMVVEETIYK